MLSSFGATAFDFLECLLLNLIDSPSKIESRRDTLLPLLQEETDDLRERLEFRRSG